jgi:hypothetical protein
LTKEDTGEDSLGNEDNSEDLNKTEAMDSANGSSEEAIEKLEDTNPGNTDPKEDVIDTPSDEGGNDDLEMDLKMTNGISNSKKLDLILINLVNEKLHNSDANQKPLENQDTFTSDIEKAMHGEGAGIFWNVSPGPPGLAAVKEYSKDDEDTEDIDEEIYNLKLMIRSAKVKDYIRGKQAIKTHKDNILEEVKR